LACVKRWIGLQCSGMPVDSILATWY